MKKILITGITGFIGKHIINKIDTKKYKITAIIRPATDRTRYEKLLQIVDFQHIDLTDTKKLNEFLNESKFDTILHIGAIRGGRKFSKSDYFKANVDATEQLILNAKRNNSKFIFCSSVGVFGAIPVELPANNHTKKQKDNYYHFTKIKSEELIQQHVISGLNAIIVRPSITYGIGDYGFPYTLIKLVDKKIMVYPKTDKKIHFTNANILASTFIKLIETDFKSGDAIIVADKEAVFMDEIVNYISKELRDKTYPKNRRISNHFFEIGEKFARKIKSELWVSRFELISREWYYDTSTGETKLNIQPGRTLSDFKNVIDWYKKGKLK